MIGEMDSLTHSVTLSMSDENFGKLVSGKGNAQQLFMSGKLKIKGNAMKVRMKTSHNTRCIADDMKAMKLEPILKKAQNKAKL